MRYPRILEKLYRGMWVVRQDTHDAMLAALEARLEGHRVSAEDVISEASDKTDELYSQVSDTVVIKVFGILGKHLDALEMMCGGCSLDAISDMVSVVESDTNIRNVCFHFHSPGGTVQGTPEVAAQIADLGTRKNTMAFTDGDCCSGALWLASQCNQFYSTQSADIGSVGVRMVLLDLTRQMEMDGVKANPIFAGKYKLSGASFQPLQPDERDMFQSDCDVIYAQFKEAVISRRFVEDQSLQGWSYSGIQAAQIGFTDGVVSDIHEALSLFPSA